MEIAGLKNNIIEKIKSSNDFGLINYINQIIEVYNNEELSDIEKELLTISLKQYKNNEVFTNEAVEKEMLEWLEK